jgi:branched-chain amino acid transport system ATP-binding protein
LLRLEGVDAFYSDLQALFDVSLEVRERDIVAPRRGRVLFGGDDLARVPAHRRVGLGMVQVPEGRRLFPFMTVMENLLLGAHGGAARSARGSALAYVFSLFPILAQRRGQLAGSLSGGEQQMCAIGRALMARPRLLMLDEPPLGLAPLLVRQIFETVRKINADGVTILLVEQNVRQALTVAHRACVLESGRLVLDGPAQQLLGDERLKRAYLGL